MSGQTAFDKPIRLAAVCRGETAENRKLEEDVETEFSGVEEGQCEMLDDARLAREGIAQKQTDKGERRARSNTRAVQILVSTLHDGQRPHPSPRCKTKKSEDQSQMKSVANAQNKLRRIVNLHCGERRQTSEHHEQRCVEKGSRGTLDNREGGEVHCLAWLP